MFLLQVPRSLVFVMTVETNKIERVLFGLRKFGGVDEHLMGSNHLLADLIARNVPLSMQVFQKHNGEASTISGIMACDEVTSYFSYYSRVL